MSALLCPLKTTSSVSQAYRPDSSTCRIWIFKHRTHVGTDFGAHPNGRNTGPRDRLRFWCDPSVIWPFSLDWKDSILLSGHQAPPCAHQGFRHAETGQPDHPPTHSSGTGRWYLASHLSFSLTCWEATCPDYTLVPSSITWDLTRRAGKHHCLCDKWKHSTIMQNDINDSSNYSGLEAVVTATSFWGT